MPTLVTAFQDDVRLNIASPTFVGQQTGIVGPAWSQWFSVTSPIPGKNVLAASFEFTANLTASATVATQTQNPSSQAIDVLDEFVDQLAVGPAPNVASRSTTETRESIEEVERIVFNLPFSYPRGAPHSFTATTGTATDTATLIVPVGGPAASVRVHVPNITGVYTASVTASISITVRAIVGTISSVVTFKDGQTATLSSGQNDLSAYFPANLSPDYLSMVGDTTSTVTAFHLTGQNGSVVVDIDSSGMMSAMQTGIAPATTKSTGFNTLAFALQKLRFRTITEKLASSESQQLLWISVDGGSTAPSPGPSATPPAPPAYAEVGHPLAGGAPLTTGVPKGNSGRIIRRK